VNLNSHFDVSRIPETWKFPLGVIRQHEHSTQTSLLSFTDLRHLSVALLTFRKEPGI